LTDGTHASGRAAYWRIVVVGFDILTFNAFSSAMFREEFADAAPQKCCGRVMPTAIRCDNKAVPCFAPHATCLTCYRVSVKISA